MWLTDPSALGRAASAHISIVCRGSVSTDISIPCLLHSSSPVVLPLWPLEIIAGEVSPQACCCLLRTELLAAGCLPLVCLGKTAGCLPGCTCKPPRTVTLAKHSWKVDVALLCFRHSAGIPPFPPTLTLYIRENKRAC